MYSYYFASYEARERTERRKREAAAERIIRRSRAHRQRRRRAQLTEALGLLSLSRRQAARLRASA